MLTQREYVRLKTRLTRAKNSGDAARVAAEVEYAVEIFNAQGWPDLWPIWRNALEDAAWNERWCFGDPYFALSERLFGR